MNAERVECEAEDQAPGIFEQTLPPPGGAQRDAPLGGAEARLELPDLHKATGSLSPCGTIAKPAYRPACRSRAVAAMKVANQSDACGGGDMKRVTSGAVIKGQQRCAVFEAQFTQREPAAAKCGQALTPEVAWPMAWELAAPAGACAAREKGDGRFVHGRTFLCSSV